MIVGIDTSSRSVAIVKMDGKRFEQYKLLVPAKERDRAKILATMYAYTNTLVNKGDRVYVETPISGRLAARNLQSTIKQSAGYGAVLAACHMTGASVIEVAPSLWKVDTLGNGNASKVDVADFLHRTHPSVHRECSGDQDLMDASCIALYGVQHTGMAERIDRGNVLHQAEDPQDPRYGRC